jgi:signal transduction histidine kinase
LDIKSKKSKPFYVWLCFFLGVNILAILMIFGIAVSKEIYNNFDDLVMMLRSDFKNTREFKHTVTLQFANLSDIITEQISVKSLSTLDDEGENLIYYAKNLKTGRVLTNSNTHFTLPEDGSLSLPEGYNYFLYYNGDKFIAAKDGRTLNIRHDSGYSHLEHWGAHSNNPQLADCRILLIVKKDIIRNPNASSSFYQGKQGMAVFKLVAIGITSIFLLGIVLSVFSLFNRDVKREFDKKLAKISGKLWFEVKVLISFFALFLIFINDWIFIYDLTTYAIKVFTVIICCWWFYIMFVDLLINRHRFFSNNSINSVIKLYRSFERKKPFQKAMLLRAYMFIAAEIVLVLLIGMFSLYLFFDDRELLIFPLLIFIAICIYLIYRYFRRYSNTINDIGKVIDQIQVIKDGNMTTKLSLNPDTDMYFVAENLNGIQEGISKAVDEKIKSERMKIELITNVSHDLKTPLTSIISYVDLLSKEEGLPDHVNDYIKILINKSDKLKTLIQDLFDLAKATSGDMQVKKEKIDLGKLIQQTLVDLDKQIEQSKLAFKVNIPQQPIQIISDGKKLYRVFLNLILNALKYSLLGSRVYIDLIADNNKAVAVIKNTANYEMDFSEDEILERFVRGDKARSTEGSGLGLAIAQNYTQACGGRFDIKIDGDLFKVRLLFDIVQ